MDTKQKSAARDKLRAAREAHERAGSATVIAFRLLRQALENDDRDAVGELSGEYVRTKTEEAESFVRHEIAYYKFLRS